MFGRIVLSCCCSLKPLCLPACLLKPSGALNPVKQHPGLGVTTHLLVPGCPSMLPHDHNNSRDNGTGLRQQG